MQPPSRSSRRWRSPTESRRPPSLRGRRPALRRWAGLGWLDQPPRGPRQAASALDQRKEFSLLTPDVRLEKPSNARGGFGVHLLAAQPRTERPRLGGAHAPPAPGRPAPMADPRTPPATERRSPPPHGNEQTPPLPRTARNRPRLASTPSPIQPAPDGERPRGHADGRETTGREPNAAAFSDSCTIRSFPSSAGVEGSIPPP